MAAFAAHPNNSFSRTLGTDNRMIWQDVCRKSSQQIIPQKSHELSSLASIQHVDGLKLFVVFRNANTRSASSLHKWNIKHLWNKMEMEWHRRETEQRKHSPWNKAFKRSKVTCNYGSEQHGASVGVPWHHQRRDNRQEMSEITLGRLWRDLRARPGEGQWIEGWRTGTQSEQRDGDGWLWAGKDEAKMED